MRLVFLGDISVEQSCPHPGHITPALHSADYILANLEGAILFDTDVANTARRNPLALYNSPSVINLLHDLSINVVSLANNHMCDLPVAVAHTRDILARAGVTSFGAGANLAEASKACTFTKGKTIVKLFAFGWDVIDCQLATQDREGVNPLTPEHTLNTIHSLRSVDDSSFVIFIVHWNYELELYPQPAHRQLAHDLIREGVDAIIGLHSHVAQGAELVDGKPVVYGLGNWFFPTRQLGHVRLAYPAIASRELALELDIKGRQVQDVRFHWHHFNAERSSIHFERTEGWDGTILRQLTPCAGMSHQEYVHWFKANRTRRRGLPVYEDYRHVRRNRIRDRYVKLRQTAIGMLVRLGLKGGPRE